MLVGNWMTKNIITIDAESSMYEATRLLKKNNIRMLPVMKQAALAGVVTDRDLKRASASDATALEIHELFYLLENIKVSEVMSKKLITVSPEHTLEETAEILMSNKISGAPVVDNSNEIIGVITQSDIFRGLMALTGISRKGVQMAFRIEDRPGSIKEITDIIREYGGRMVSILSTSDGIPEGYRNVYIRFYGIEHPEIIGLTDMFRSKDMLIYVVDHRENRREIFKKK